MITFYPSSAAAVFVPIGIALATAALGAAMARYWGWKTLPALVSSAVTGPILAVLAIGVITSFWRASAILVHFGYLILFLGLSPALIGATSVLLLHRATTNFR